MNRFTPYKPSTNSDPHCADFMTMAERELSAFFHAVTQLFGAEQAERSAEDWLHELSEIGALPSSTREWRSITTKASGKLAARVKTSALLAESQTI